MFITMTKLISKESCERTFLRLLNAIDRLHLQYNCIVLVIQIEKKRYITQALPVIGQVWVRIKSAVLITNPSQLDVLRYLGIYSN